MMKAIVLFAVLCLSASALAKPAELEIIELWVEGLELAGPAGTPG